MTLPKKAKKPDLRDPKRRVSTAWVRNFVKNYHDTHVAPLIARIVVLETLVANNSEARNDDIQFVDKAAREELEKWREHNDMVEKGLTTRLDKLEKPFWKWSDTK